MKFLNSLKLDRVILLLLISTVIGVSGCASQVRAKEMPITLSIDTGHTALCVLSNDRGRWTSQVPGTINVIESKESLIYKCTTNQNNKIFGQIPSLSSINIVLEQLGQVHDFTRDDTEYPLKYIIRFKPSPTKFDLMPQPRTDPM